MATSRSKQTAKPKAKTAAKAKPRPAKAAKAAAKSKPAMKAKPVPAKKAPPAAKPAPKPVKVAAAPPKPAVKAGPKPLNKGALAAKALADAAKAAKAAKAKVPPKKKVAAPAVVRPLGVLPPEARMPEARMKVVEKAPQFAARPRPTSPHPISKPAAPGVQRVSEKDLKLFEERLLAERQKIMKEMGHLEDTVLKVNQRDSSGDLSGYSFHMADAGTDAMEREKAFMFASSEGRMLMEINEALRRIYAGEYGMCEMCGNPIARARLEAMPYARLCVSCKEQEEKANRGKAQAPTGPGSQ